MEAASVVHDRPERIGFVSAADLERIRTLDADPAARAAAFADACRINALSMIMEAGSGHIGTSFSVMEILAWLHLETLEGDDVQFSSKGHDSPGTYSVLIGAGKLDWDRVHDLRRHGGLPGHPSIESVPEVHTNTGSLGMGISKAKGFARAARLRGGRRRVFVVTGDGELQEGQFWESLQGAANEAFGEITVIVDHNKIQSDTWVSEVSDLGDLEAKVAAFGWAVARCDGNDVEALGAALGELEASAPDRPKLLVADTIKGKGVGIFEPHDLPKRGDALYAYHSGAPSPEEYQAALLELRSRLDQWLDDLGTDPVALEEFDVPARPMPATPQKLIAAYGDALTAAAERDERIVALDADLSLDTGLVGFRARFPERFVECGIAEQDMVSQAGTLALSGFLPVCHSFASFMTPRANEQIFNNATERSKVVYHGALAGIVPGGPGHSHQSVRDIALMGSVPGMACLEPATAHEAKLCIDWAVDEAEGPVYIRFVSVPWPLGFEAPQAERLVRGQGTVARADGDVVLVTTGPVLASQAWQVDRAAVVLLPWLRGVDGDWLREVAGGREIVVLDNHMVDSGQGSAVLAALPGERVRVFGVEDVPAGGGNLDVLKAHGLDAESIAARL
ncbi:MAG TPA: 1-deoxy-D-xylulose-5-phosphate synthase N-terminal domain-containing protein [Solirubrobacteraceae bacterium]|nr:1-deoxy-D-xylulose-5-phosphate synthase N-terminal domain-containing protein [Solirubrobacteraceae bacterium]